MINFNEEKKGSLFVYENNKDENYIMCHEPDYAISKIYTLKSHRVYFLIFDKKIENKLYFYVISEKDPCKKYWIYQGLMNQKYFGNHLKKISV